MIAVPCAYCPAVMQRKLAHKGARCDDCRRAWEKAWRLSHPDSQYAAQKKWRLAHAEKIAADVKAWRKANPEKYARLQQRAHRRFALKQKQLNEEVLKSLPCLECGVSHSLERRQAVIRRALPATREEIIDAWPCFWQGTAGQSRLERDLHSMGAYSHKWIWQMRSAA